MVWVRATVLGRLGRKPSPHPRAGALSCPPPAIYGPGLGHFTRPVLCHRAGVLRGSGLLSANIRSGRGVWRGFPGPTPAVLCEILISLTGYSNTSGLWWYV